MALARRVGLGLASRGSVKDAVRWAERARSAGLESVWFHDSYFERDAVSYASAVASQPCSRSMRLPFRRAQFSPI